MTGKRGNGNGRSKDETLETLKAILDVQRGMAEAQGVTNARLEAVEQVLRGHGRQLEALHSGLAEVRDGLADLRGEVHEGFAELGEKITSATERDRHLEEHVRDLGERVARLEAREGGQR